MGGDAPDKQLSPVPGAINEAQSFIADNPETQARIEKVAELINGFESPYGLELLSTVHWVLDKGNVQDFGGLVREIHDWNYRKRQFTERQINLAFKVLMNKGWVQDQGLNQ